MKKTEEELRLHISRLEAIIDHMPFEVWYKDSDGKYLIVNNKVAEYFGNTKCGIIGKNDFDLYPADQAEAFIGTDHAAMGGDLGYYELHLGSDIYQSAA